MSSPTPPPPSFSHTYMCLVSPILSLSLTPPTQINLLRKAVLKLGTGRGPTWLKKISWKDVAEYIVDNGGSYRFGNATCRKKWDEMAEEEGY